MARGRLYVGTSGFAYKEWKPDFYPADLKDGDMLRYYAERLPSVEINNTFYRSPSEKVLRAWSEQTPESFVFTLKASQKITHVKRLRDVGEPLGYFLDAARSLGPRLGCILFQCPPNLRYDAGRLDDFLAALPGAPFRFAMEFRHASWATDEVRRKLADAAVAWCAAETDDETVPLVQTTDAFVYLRLRRSSYDKRALEARAREVRTALDAGADAYVYFKHEDDPSGTRYALRLREIISGAAGVEGGRGRRGGPGDG